MSRPADEMVTVTLERAQLTALWELGIARAAAAEAAEEREPANFGGRFWREMVETIRVALYPAQRAPSRYCPTHGFDWLGELHQAGHCHCGQLLIAIPGARKPAGGSA